MANKMLGLKLLEALNQTKTPVTAAATYCGVTPNSVRFWFDNGVSSRFETAVGEFIVAIRKGTLTMPAKAPKKPRPAWERFPELGAQLKAILLSGIITHTKLAKVFDICNASLDNWIRTGVPARSSEQVSAFVAAHSKVAAAPAPAAAPIQAMTEEVPVYILDFAQFNLSTLALGGFYVFCDQTKLLREEQQVAVLVQTGRHHSMAVVPITNLRGLHSHFRRGK